MLEWCFAPHVQQTVFPPARFKARWCVCVCLLFFFVFIHIYILSRVFHARQNPTTFSCSVFISYVFFVSLNNVQFVSTFCECVWKNNHNRSAKVRLVCYKLWWPNVDGFEWLRRSQNLNVNDWEMTINTIKQIKPNQFSDGIVARIRPHADKYT